MKLQRVAENLCRRLPGGQYYAVCSVGNRKCVKSLETVNRRVAESKLRDALQKMRNTSPDAGTFEAVSESWRTTVLAGKDLKAKARQYRQETLDRLLKDFPELKSKPISQVTLADCERWKARRRQVGSVTRYNGELETLRMVFTYAKSHKLIADNPAAAISREQYKPKEAVIPTRAQFEAMITDLRSRVRCVEAANIIEFMAYSGLRINEANKVLWSDIDWDRKRLRVTGGDYGTKNRRVRYMPLFPPLERLLRGLTQYQPQVFDINDPKKALEQVCQRLKLPKFNNHSFRHFFVSNAIHSGIDVAKIALWVGHQDGGVTLLKTYSHVFEDQEAEAAAKMQYSATAWGSSMGQQQKTGSENKSQSTDSK